jgi:hypothetical protein
MNSLYFEDELQPMRPIDQLMYIQSASLIRVYLKAWYLTQSTYCIQLSLCDHFMLQPLNSIDQVSQLYICSCHVF